MKAFISYSFEDSELYLITLLFEYLRKNSYSVESSSTGFNSDSSYRIQKSDVFIGIISDNTHNNNYVIKEWSIAKTNKIPCILLVEDTVKLAEDDTENSCIRFNRAIPEPAIQKVKSFASTPKKSNMDSVIGGIIIGATVAAGLAALLSLLSDDKK